MRNQFLSLKIHEIECYKQIYVYPNWMHEFFMRSQKKCRFFSPNQIKTNLLFIAAANPSYYWVSKNKQMTLWRSSSALQMFAFDFVLSLADLKFVFFSCWSLMSSKTTRKVNHFQINFRFETASRRMKRSISKLMVSHGFMHKIKIKRFRSPPDWCA